MKTIYTTAAVLALSASAAAAQDAARPARMKDTLRKPADRIEAAPVDAEVVDPEPGDVSSDASAPDDQPAPADDALGLPLDDAAPAGVASAEEVQFLIGQVRGYAIEDIADGSSAAAAIEAYASKLAIIHKADPAAHDALVAEIEGMEQ